MASSNSVESGDETDATDSESTAAVSWGPIRFTRFRSLILGWLFTVTVVILIGSGVLTTDLLNDGSLPVSSVLLLVLVVVGGAVSLVYRMVAHDASTSTERGSVRERVLELLSEWSGIRPLWVGYGAAVGLGVAWIGSESLVSTLQVLPLVLVIYLLIVLSMRGNEYTVDPDRTVVSTYIPGRDTSSSYMEQNDRRVEQQLTWAVGVRRVDLGIVSLFVFSNRGKRWYEGPHLLPVPTELAADVERTLRQMVTEQQSPPRIQRDERLVIRAVGFSMIGIGPLLYLLSSEFALLLVTTGPSTFIAAGLLVHSVVG